MKIILSGVITMILAILGVSLMGVILFVISWGLVYILIDYILQEFSCEI